MHLQKITFTYPHKYCDKSSCDADDCSSSYIHLAKFEEQGLQNPDEIVAPPNIIIQATYPLNDTYYFKYDSEYPFTRKELAKTVSELYQEIYKDRETYGIWGHGIEDLDLNHVRLIGRKGKHLLYSLSVDS